MGHMIKVEQYGIDHKLEESREYRVSGWEGVWLAVEDEMDRTGRIPTGMEGWDESGCVLTEGHDCDTDPDQCRQHLKNAIKEWIKASWEHDELKTGSFCFAGSDWSAITFGWDGN